MSGRYFELIGYQRKGQLPTPHYNHWPNRPGLVPTSVLFEAVSKIQCSHHGIAHTLGHCTLHVQPDIRARRASAHPASSPHSAAGTPSTPATTSKLQTCSAPQLRAAFSQGHRVYRPHHLTNVWRALRLLVDNDRSHLAA